MPPPRNHYVYMLRCSNGTIYTGQTYNLEQRMKRHLMGTGARHTAGIKPIELIYSEGPMAYSDAIVRDRQIKKWSRAKKLALAAGDFDQLQSLSRTRQSR